MAIRAAMLIMLAALSACASSGAALAASRVGPAPFTFEDETVTLTLYVPDATETPRVALTQTATDIVVTAASARGLTADAPCVVDSATVARCPLASLDPKAFGVLAASPTGGPLTLDTAPDVTIPILGWGRPEHADHIVGGSGGDLLAPGWGGTADGGAGDDFLLSLAARGATLLGGPGKDELSNAAVADGGPGDDEISSAVTADGGPGDDELGGVRFGTGGDGDDRLDSSGVGGAVRLDGGPGRDSLGASTRGAVLHGGPGDDFLYECPDCDVQGALLAGDGGDDTFFGSTGGTTLDGGDGADRFVVVASRADDRARPDAIRAGAGNDTVYAADEVRESIDCGDGQDKATHDAQDALTACEAEETSAPATPGAGGRDPSSPESGGATTSRPLRLVGAPRRLRATKVGIVAVRLACPAGVTCAAAVALRHGGRDLAARTVRFKGTRTVALHLRRASLALLRRRGTLKATLVFTAGAKSGTTRMPAARPVTLLAPRRR